MPSADAWSRSLSGVTCQQRGCGKIEMWIKAGKCPDSEEGVSLCLYLVFFSTVRSCLIRGNPSSPERWAIFRFTLTWPRVNTLLLILYSLFPDSPSPHTHARSPACFPTHALPNCRRLTSTEVHVVKWWNLYSWSDEMLQWRPGVVTRPFWKCSYSRIGRIRNYSLLLESNFVVFFSFHSLLDKCKSSAYSVRSDLTPGFTHISHCHILNLPSLALIVASFGL